MGCDDWKDRMPQRDTAYVQVLGYVQQLTAAASYGRQLLEQYRQRGAYINELERELAEARAAADRYAAMACTCHYGGPTCQVHGWIGHASAAVRAPGRGADDPNGANE